jgi:hypothetical protein
MSPTAWLRAAVICYPASIQAWRTEAAVKALAGSVVIAMVLAAAATLFSAPAPTAQKNLPKLRIESPAVDPQTTPSALEQRFGRGTLLYFPMDRGTAAPVALQTIIDASKLIDPR